MTTRISDQKNNDSTPSTFGSVVATAWDLLASRHSLTAYSGDVPMSP
jgi:hypothetical protein